MLERELRKEAEKTDDSALYDRYGSIIFAYGQLHLASREDAEDLTLDVFMKALELDNLAALREEEKLAWLRRVARNRLIDRYRHTTRHPLTPLDDDLCGQLEDDANTPEHVALRKESYSKENPESIHVRLQSSLVKELQITTVDDNEWEVMLTSCVDNTSDCYGGN